MSHVWVKRGQKIGSFQTQKVSHYQGDIVAYRDGAVIIADGNLGNNYDRLSEVWSPGTASWSDFNKSETVAWLTEFASVEVNGNIMIIFFMSFIWTKFRILYIDLYMKHKTFKLYDITNILYSE